MRQDTELKYKYLNRLYPTKSDDDGKYIDMAGVDSFKDIMTALDINQKELFDWILSIFPNGKYCIKWTDGTKQWMDRYDIHRDDDKPAIIFPDGKEFFYEHNERKHLDFENNCNIIIGSNMRLNKVMDSLLDTIKLGGLKNKIDL